MRIALVVERFEASGGGVEGVVWNLARGLAEAGDEVSVIARQGSEAPHARLLRISVPTGWQALRVARFARRSAALARERRSEFDVVHAFCRSLEADWLAAGWGSHAAYMRHTYGGAGAALRRLSPRHAVQLALERRIFRCERTRIQCVSEMVRRELRERFEIPDGRMTLLHNGVDPERFRPDLDPSLRRELGAGEAPVWLLAGSNWHRKGLDTALAALARAGDRSAELWIAGADAAPRWRRLAERLRVADRVRFLGSRSDLERVFAAADALLLPSRYDAFGQVVLEAAASGRPVVTSSRVGAAELVAEAGIVVEDAEDVEGFARALDRLSDPALRGRLGAAGRRVAERHSWQCHVETLRALYAQSLR